MQIRKWKAYQRVKPNAQQPFQAIASFVGSSLLRSAKFFIFNRN